MATAKNTLQQLQDHGQSPWLDYITRDILKNGRLQELIELGIVGLTSNPTIFQKAISGSQLYDDELRRLVREGKSVEEIYDALVLDDIRIASVASFFVSRVDTAVDHKLDQLIEATYDEARTNELRALQGKAAIANAKLAYDAYKEIFAGPRWDALAQKGARTQRCLWASTSTKNPKYRDILYAEQLIGPDTVDTMTPATIEAFLDHGVVERTVDKDVDQARAELAAIEKAGISMDEVTLQLQKDGVKLFADSFDELINAISARRQEMMAHAR